LLKAPTHRFVEGKSRSFDIVGPEDAGTNAFLDDFLDEVDIGEVKIQHMCCPRMVRRRRKEVPFEQESFEKIALRIAEFETGLDEAVEFFEWSGDFLYFRTNLVGEILHALLDRGFKQFLFGVKVEIDGSFSDARFFGYTVDGGPLKSVPCDHSTGCVENLADTKLADQIFFFCD
jgi:hypothetical protein